MNILIDFILCILAIVTLLIATGKNTIVTIARFLALVLSVTVATFLADWAAAPLSEKIPNPMVQVAVNEMADAVGTPIYGKVDQTLAQLDYDAFMTSPDRAELVKSYGRTEAQIQQLLADAENQNAAAVAAFLAQPIWQTIIEAVLLGGATILLYLVLVAVFRTVLYRTFPKDKKKKVAIFTVLFAVLSAVIVVSYVAVPIMESFRPYAMGFIKSLQWDYACEQSTLYGIFKMLYILG